MIDKAKYMMIGIWIFIVFLGASCVITNTAPDIVCVLKSMLATGVTLFLWETLMSTQD